VPEVNAGRRKRGKQEAMQDGQEDEMHINDLQIDILQRIFSILDQQDRCDAHTS
jgi:hypothetical protein